MAYYLKQFEKLGSEKEEVGVAASADTDHISAFVHGDIAHTNRAALDLVSGENTGDQDLASYALTSYVNDAVTGLLDFKGNIDAQSIQQAFPNYPVALKGDAYYVSVAGKVGGASGKSVEVGDLLVAKANNGGGSEASVGTSWFVMEHNLVGAMVGSNNLSDVADRQQAIDSLTGIGSLTLNGQVLTVDPAGQAKWAAPSGGGGLTNFTEGVNTSSPNATVPVVSIVATGGAVDIDAAFSPKGTGALTAAIANNATSGGNKRGANAIDLQTLRTAATQVASGLRSTVVGNGNTASGDNATAIGYNNTATNGATAIGYGNTASGSYTSSVAFGRNNTSSGNYAVAFGRSNNAAASGSAVGCQNYTSSGSYASAIGFDNRTTGTRAAAIGHNNRADGAYSSAFGNYNTASADRSSAFGHQVKTTVANTQEFGYWSDSTVRAGTIRLHAPSSTTGYAAISLLDTGTALTDGGATHGSEANGTLMRGGYSIRRNNDALFIDVNIGGTVKTLSLGNAV